MNRKTTQFGSLAAAMGLMFSSTMAAEFGESAVYRGPVPLVVPAAGEPLETTADEQAKFTAAQLRDMVGPIALYPDPLLAQVLAGATYPLDIVQANRFIKANANDPALSEKIAAAPWDPSVQALAHYPGVLNLMDENLEWTQNLGAAFMYQQADVMAAIQESRALAQAAGNLATTREQVVVVEERIIQIVPADPQVIYVPVYEPEIVYVQRRPDYFGHVISFGFGISVGSWLDLDCDWNRHRIYHGGWYQHHHGHSSRPDVHIQVNNNTHVYRDSNGPRNDRDDRRDFQNQPDRSRNDSAWQRNAAKPAPQVRQVAAAPTANRGNPADRNVRIDNAERPDRSASAYRPVGGYVRPVEGYSRQVTPPVAGAVNARAAQTDRNRPATTLPQANSNDRTSPRFNAEGRADTRGANGNDTNRPQPRATTDQQNERPTFRATEIQRPALIPTPGDERKVEPVRPPVNQMGDRPALRPATRDDVKAPEFRPPVNQSNDRPAFRPVPSVPAERAAVQPPAAVTPAIRSEDVDRSPGFRGNVNRETISRPQAPVVTPRATAPRVAPPTAAPRIEPPRPAPRVITPPVERPASRTEVKPSTSRDEARSSGSRSGSKKR